MSPNISNIPRGWSPTKTTYSRGYPYPPPPSAHLWNPQPTHSNSPSYAPDRAQLWRICIDVHVVLQQLNQNLKVVQPQISNSLIPHTTSCREYIFYPSINPVLVSSTPLKQLNKISWNFELNKDILYRWYFFLGVMSLWF